MSNLRAGCPLWSLGLMLMGLIGCGGGSGNTLVLAPSQITVEVGQSRQFIAELRNAAGELLSDPLTWSVTGAIGVVDATGLFTAQRIGEGTVAVQGGGKQASARIVVIAEVGLVSIRPSEATVATGGTIGFQVEVLDVNGDPITGVAPLWEVIGNIGTINHQGAFKAGKNPGLGSVRATVGSLSAEASVTVTGEVASLAVEPAQAEVEVNGFLRLKAVAKDAAGNTLTVSASWSLNPAGLGSIDAQGFFQAGAQTGTATVTAQVGSRNATARITLVPRSQPPPLPGNLRGSARLQGETDFSGTTVTVTPGGGGDPVATASTDPQGRFGFWLEVGDYQLRFQHGGFQTAQRNVTLAFPDQVLNLQVTLQPEP